MGDRGRALAPHATKGGPDGLRRFGLARLGHYRRSLSISLRLCGGWGATAGARRIDLRGGVSEQGKVSELV